MAVEIVNADASDNNETPDETEDTTVEVHGDVETVEEGDVTEVEEGDTNVTVIDSDADAVEAVVTEQVIEDAVTLALLEQRVSAQELRLVELEGRVAAFESRQAADEVAVIETVAEIQDEIEDEEGDGDEDGDEDEDEEDREPASAGPHAMFRPWRDFFGKDK
jgi:hypothetical protein